VTDRIQVVCGALPRTHRAETQWLVGRRATGRDYPLRWEFPGGKVEHNETHEHALIREWQEELHVRVTPAGRIATFDYDPGPLETRKAFRIELHLLIPGPEPIGARARVHVDLRWMYVSQMLKNLHAHNSVPSMEPFAQAVAAYEQQQMMRGRRV